jgi:hypothetical protein
MTTKNGFKAIVIMESKKRQEIMTKKKQKEQQ